MVNRVSPASKRWVNAVYIKLLHVRIRATARKVLAHKQNDADDLVRFLTFEFIIRQNPDLVRRFRCNRLLTPPTRRFGNIAQLVSEIEHASV